MKTILVLTDFSDNAAHAAQSALNLAVMIHADVLLFNAYQTIPVSNYYIGAPWGGESPSYWEDHSESNIQTFQKHLEPLINKVHPEQFKPAINTLCREGNLGELVNEIVQQKNIGLIVMGSRSDNAFEHIFSGSDTYAVIEHASCPVLILREKMELTQLGKIVFASNFSPEDIKSLQYLVKLGELFNTKLELVHIMPSESLGTATNEGEVEFMKQVAALNYPYITFKNVKGKEVVERLNHLCEEEQANALAIIHHKHSFFIRMLKQSLAHQALDKQKIPLLVFPAKMN
jgi:nucleotide-binding universal stress UspA family protein